MNLILAICRELNGKRAILHKHTFTHTDLADCIVQKCNDEDIVMDKECVFADSDFQKLMGRNGNYEVL